VGASGGVADETSIAVAEGSTFTRAGAVRSGNCAEQDAADRRARQQRKSRKR
jgi:hypothetical protein